MSKKVLPEIISQVCDEIMKNTAVVITAGFRMSADSGIPDMRISKNFFREYPDFNLIETSHNAIKSPDFFRNFPKRYWHYYGDRANLFKETPPHEGYEMIREMMDKLKKGNYFVVTNNIDGQFLRSGYDPNKIFELYGNLNYLFCEVCRKEYRDLDIGIEKYNVNKDVYELSNPPDCPSCECTIS